MEKGVFQEDFLRIFQVNLEPKLKTKEKKLLDKIFKKIESGDFPFKLSIGEFYHIYKKKDKDEIKNEIIKLSKKKFVFKVLNNSGEVYSGEFNLISSFYMGEGDIIIMPPYEMIKSVDKESSFNKLHISTYTRFKEKHSFKFYPLILNNLGRSSFDCSVEELKKVLNVEDNYYERFYDFEKNILKPLMADINKSSTIDIRYEKIKKGAGKTSKIDHLTFYILDETELEISQNISDVLNIVKNKVNNLSYLHKLVENAMKTHSKESIMYKVKWIEERFSSPLDLFLEAALLSGQKIDRDKLQIVEVEEKFSSHFKIEGRIYRELAKYKFSYDYHFLQELQNLRLRNKFDYNKSPWKIEAEYKKNEKSKIKIYIG